MTEQLPDSEMQLLIADAVRYRFLRDVVPAIINEILNDDENYEWDKYVGFESIYYAKGDGTAEVKNGKDLDDAIDAELGIMVDKEIAEKIKETE
jgi:hypothetical protein